jgi:hypothetical protein
LEEVVNAERIHALILRKKIPESVFRDLCVAVAMYASRSVSGQWVALSEDELMEQLRKHREHLRNATPNGLLTPKQNLTLEYNAVVKAYVDVIDAVGLPSKFIHGWNPPQVRYKDGVDKFDAESIHRPYATEKIHSDTWVSVWPESVSTMLPLFGDTKHNRVDFFEYPDLPEDNWICPVDDYEHMENIAQGCERLSPCFEKGYLILRDITMLHVTTRDPGAGARISIDSYFTTSKPKGGRAQEQFTYDELRSVGTTEILAAPDALGEQIETTKKQSSVNVYLTPILKI